MNPVRAWRVSRAPDGTWSSAGTYLNGRDDSVAVLVPLLAHHWPPDGGHPLDQRPGGDDRARPHRQATRAETEMRWKLRIK